mgnify:CR=1 FL=1
MRFKEFIDIDSLRHAKVEEKPVNNYKGDYKELSIAKPSSNGSDKTYQELNDMQDMFKDRNEVIEKSVKDHDLEVGHAVKQYLKNNNLDFKETDVNKLADIGGGIVRYYKNKFERIRPYQLAEALKMKFDHMPLDSDSMKSPAYPSGHSLQSRLNAEYYVEQYPEHKKGLIAAAEETGKGRIYAGWHYPSDHEAAVKLAKQIYPNITMRKTFKESIIDIPRRTYAPKVFDDADTKDPKIKAICLFGPNIAVFDPLSKLLSKPWGLQIARLVKGGNYHIWENTNSEKKKYWTTKTRLESATHMQKFLDVKMNKSTFERVKKPVFMGYYFKNEKFQDSVVSVEAMLKMFDQLGTPENLKVKKAFPNAGNHVITSYLSGDNYDKVTKETLSFLNKVLEL